MRPKRNRPMLRLPTRLSDTVFVVALAFSAGAHAGPQSLASVDSARKISVGEHVFNDTEGNTLTGEKGYITVPEVRGDPDSRWIKVAFIRIPATTPTPAPPVFLLHGGPSGDAIIESRSKRLNVLTEMQDVADYILVDGRGLGTSEPRLSCPVRPDVFVYDFTRYRNTLIAAAAKCIARHKGQGMDLRGYNPREYADDVHELATALGYEKYSLTGNSFASYWAMSIIKRHGAHVYRAALSGVFGLDGAIDLPSEMQAAFEDLGARIDANPDAEKLFGQRKFVDVVDGLMRRLQQSPRDVTVRFNGREETLRFDPETLTFLLYLAGATQHRQGAAKLPGLIFALDRGAYQGVADLLTKQLEAGLKAETPEVNVSSIATICNEVNSDAFMTRFNAEKAKPMEAHWTGSFAVPYSTLFGCDELDIPRLDKSWADPFTSPVPVFAVIGSFDGNTPPDGARRALRKFPNRHEILVNGGGHRHREIEALWDDFLPLKKRFLAGKALNDVPEEIDLPIMEFDVPPWIARLGFRMGLGNFILGMM
ncbi:pimeloyl-ACP methyl ester carboxylesterase [Eilatimonas milleporae]|uniref:Pimeloyl-ACP methyl ester carboxylesterase n=2 Tax=Eilatimonas milleporae TaxID=911205 RepID=A0A3M0C532_9PROT|nr:pimeloyl-ACP methyl ester carboxylesterase [Eilatimonas milleporae]